MRIRGPQPEPLRQASLPPDGGSWMLSIAWLIAF